MGNRDTRGVYDGKTSKGHYSMPGKSSPGGKYCYGPEKGNQLTSGDDEDSAGGGFSSYYGPPLTIENLLFKKDLPEADKPCRFNFGPKKTEIIEASLMNIIFDLLKEATP